MNNILFQALAWHFYDTPKEILKGWGNFLSFSLNYFSIPTLIVTFLAPWRRYGEAYGKTFDLKKNLEALIFNSMSRIIGAILRTGLIITGLLFGLLVFIIGLLIFILWILTPVILIILIIFGIKLLL